MRRIVVLLCIVMAMPLAGCGAAEADPVPAPAPVVSGAPGTGGMDVPVTDGVPSGTDAAGDAGTAPDRDGAGAEDASVQGVPESATDAAVAEDASVQGVPESVAADAVTASDQDGPSPADPDAGLMADVDTALSELAMSEGFQVADKDGRAAMTAGLLDRYEAAGEISGVAYDPDGGLFSFTYANGWLGGFMVVPFDPMMN